MTQQPQSPLSKALITNPPSRHTKSLPSLALPPDATTKEPEDSAIRIREERPSSRKHGVLSPLVRKPTSRTVDYAQVQQEAQQLEAIERAVAHEKRASAKQIKEFQLEQMQRKQQLQHEKKLEAQALSEQMEWEQAQLALVEIDRLQQLQQQRLALREAHVHAVDVETRRRAMDAIVQTFYDKLAILSPRKAVERFHAKKDELLATCLQHFESHVSPQELQILENQLLASFQKELETLERRVLASEREQATRQAKTQAIWQLKQQQKQQIQDHTVAKQHELEHKRTLHLQLVQEQQELDRRVHAKEAMKKQQQLEHQTKLREQIKRHEEAQTVFPFEVKGSSPIVRTPYWTDESEVRLQGFERETPIVSPPKTALEPTKIHARKSSKWYD